MESRHARAACSDALVRFDSARSSGDRFGIMRAHTLAEKRAGACEPIEAQNEDLAEEKAILTVCAASTRKRGVTLQMTTDSMIRCACEMSDQMRDVGGCPAPPYRTRLIATYTRRGSYPEERRGLRFLPLTWSSGNSVMQL